MFLQSTVSSNGKVHHYLREPYRVGSKVNKRTVARLSALPPEVVENIGLCLKGDPMLAATEAVELVKRENTLPTGHAEAVLAAMNGLRIPELLDPVPVTIQFPIPPPSSTHTPHFAHPSSAGLSSSDSERNCLMATNEFRRHVTGLGRGGLARNSAICRN
jgi:hypothetical protein